jgi:hypothetical protein
MATQARLGERVRMRTEVKGHKSRMHERVLEPGGFGVTETTSARQLLCSYSGIGCLLNKGARCGRGDLV